VRSARAIVRTVPRVSAVLRLRETFSYWADPPRRVACVPSVVPSICVQHSLLARLSQLRGLELNTHDNLVAPFATV